MSRRNYIFETIRQVYHLYGYRQIETPAMEQLSTLMGKYGEEGDKLLFKILNSGDFLSAITDDDWKEKSLPKVSARISEKGLRYDLTVPFARFVVHDGHEIGAKIPVGQAARGDGDEVALANGQVPRGADDESIGGEALAGGCDLGTGVLQEHGSLFPPGGVSARLFAHDVTRAVWFESALMSRPLIFKKYLDG